MKNLGMCRIHDIAKESNVGIESEPPEREKPREETGIRRIEMQKQAAAKAPRTAWQNTGTKTSRGRYEAVYCQSCHVKDTISPKETSGLPPALSDSRGLTTSRATARAGHEVKPSTE